MVSHKTLMTSLYDVFVTSQALLWHHRISLYKTPHVANRGFLPHLGLRVHLTLVRDSTAGYSCTLGLTHWRVPASGAYFLQLYLIGLLLLWASPRVLMPQNALTHPVSIISSTSCAIHTGLTSFWLVPVSTISIYKFTSSEAYHYWGDTSSSRMAHITYIFDNMYIW